MDQSELKQFFTWAQDNVEGFTVEPCEESVHYYINDEYIGGYAGDRREYFFKHNDSSVAALNQMLAESN